MCIAAPGAGDRASPVVGKKKKKGEGKKKKVKAGGPDSSSLGALGMDNVMVLVITKKKHNTYHTHMQ